MFAWGKDTLINLWENMEHEEIDLWRFFKMAAELVEATLTSSQEQLELQLKYKQLT